MDQRITALRGEADDLQKERDAIDQRVTVLRGAADDLGKALDGMDQRMGAARPGTVRTTCRRPRLLAVAGTRPSSWSLGVPA